MAKRKYVWFLEPKDSHTNEVVANALQDEGSFNSVLCADGISRNLWQCSAELAKSFWASKQDLALKFDVFSAELNARGSAAKPRQCNFLFRKKILRAKRALATASQSKPGS